MAFGLGDLQLAPRDFWAMTPRELAAAAHVHRSRIPEPPTRAGLKDLMQRYPDGKAEPDRATAGPT